MLVNCNIAISDLMQCIAENILSRKYFLIQIRNIFNTNLITSAY